MTIDNWLTLIGTFMGSSLVVGLLGALKDRLRFDRRTDMVKGWKDEIDIAAYFEHQAEVALGRGESVKAARYTAASHAVNVDINRRVATTIVPADKWGSLFYFGSFAVYLTAGWLLFYAAISRTVDAGGEIVLGITGIVCFGGAVLLFGLGLIQRSDRSVARRLVFETINQDGDMPPSKIYTVNGDKIEVLGGRMGLGFRRSLFGVDTALTLERFLNQAHQQRTA